MKYSWDKKLNFDQTRTLISDKLLQERQKETKDPRHLFYLCALLTQLVNGARVSEAHEAMWEFSNYGERETAVRVRKQRKNPEERKIVIPPEILTGDVEGISDLLENNGLSVDALKKFCKRTLGFNTHALRYAQISKLSEQGVPLHVIAKVTHHRNVNFLVDYTNQSVADRRLKELVNQETSG